MNYSDQWMMNKKGEKKSLFFYCGFNKNINRKNERK